jgi:hypothetical protein
LESVGSDPRPTDAFALRACVAQTGPDTLGNQAALQLSHSTQDRKDHFAGGRAGIDVLREGDEVDSQGPELFEGPKQVRGRAGETVEAPYRYNIEAALGRIVHGGCSTRRGNCSPKLSPKATSGARLWRNHHSRREAAMKNTSSYETIQADCGIRAKLWQEYVANYQKALAESPETFSAFSAEFRERYLRVTLNH